MGRPGLLLPAMRLASMMVPWERYAVTIGTAVNCTILRGMEHRHCKAPRIMFRLTFIPYRNSHGLNYSIPHYLKEDERALDDTDEDTQRIADGPRLRAQTR
ncbi:hypothetical protein VTH06DRAFT_6623 [Thermothelomyces fergusii]